MNAYFSYTGMMMRSAMASSHGYWALGRKKCLSP
jgi:hypothetical protein